MSIAYPTLPTARITSHFGWRTHPVTGERETFHHGIDMAPEIADTTGVPVYAVTSGTIARIEYNIDSRGNFIYLQHDTDSYTTHYLHLASISVSVGDSVSKGEQIGIMGSTGRSSGIHLDFGVSTSYPPVFGDPGTYIDPEPYLEGADTGGTLTPISGNFYLDRAEMTINANYIYRYLTNEGWSKQAIAGLLGNMEKESTINPGIWQNLDEGNRAIGYGTVQWTPAGDYLDWCTANGLDPGNMDTNLKRILYELENGLQYYPTASYPETFTEFTTSTRSPDYLAQAFMNNYERPADRDQPERSDYALYWYDTVTDGDISNPTDPGKSALDDYIFLLSCGALNGFT